MEIKKQYGKSNVIVLNVGQADVDGLLLNWDLNDFGKYEYMESDFINTVMNYLPEYAMGYEPSTLETNDIVDYIRKTARSVIKIKKIEEIKKNLDNHIPYEQWDEDILKTYNSKGIFSELILHFILRDLKGTVPLISKIYFKDSNAVEAHGFDAVHVIGDKLCLGETKFYNDGKRGLNALIDDLKNHFKHDYLKEQFVIISRAIRHDNPDRDKWITALSSVKRLEEKFNMIYIPLLCIYEDGVATTIIDKISNGEDADSIHLEHVKNMKEFFDKNNTFANINKIQPVLILLPVESKDKIVSAMLTKIYNMQNI